MTKTKDVLEFIAQNIRNYRKMANLTLDDLAARSNVHKNYLSRLENGDANISINKLLDICDALNIHISDVVPYKQQFPHFSNANENLEFTFEAIAKITALHKRNPYFTIDLLGAVNQLEDKQVRLLEEILRLSTGLSERDLLLVVQLLLGMNNIKLEDSV